MTGVLSIVALGFFLGMRHAVDPDHVIAVATIVSRNRGARHAAATGMLWGMGHTLTVVLVGAAIILFNVIIPPRVGLGMELAVGIVLIILGAANIVGFIRTRRSARMGVRSKAPGVHSHARCEGMRPAVVGVVHGLAGSSAVALIVLAAIRDPYWAAAYLLVFGAGTIAGMMVVTLAMASAFRLTETRSSRLTGRVGLASGFLSVGFGLFIAYQVYVLASS
jgi:high-affinity nickel-transport protein